MLLLGLRRVLQSSLLALGLYMAIFNTNKKENPASCVWEMLLTLRLGLCNSLANT